MLAIGHHRFGYSGLAYLAFRSAFFETLDWILLSRQVGDDELDDFGYMTEIPFLQTVAPQIQLDTLARTWFRVASGASVESSILDECVLYAVCETVARLVDESPEEVKRFIGRGPRTLEISVDRTLVPKLRALHLSLPIDGDFLLVSQFEDMDPSDAHKYKRKFNVDGARIEPMLELLGRWQISNEFGDNLKYLLTESEIDRVTRLIRERPIRGRWTETETEKENQ